MTVLKGNWSHDTDPRRDPIWTAEVWYAFDIGRIVGPVISVNLNGQTGKVIISPPGVEIQVSTSQLCQAFIVPPGVECSAVTQTLDNGDRIVNVCLREGSSSEDQSRTEIVFEYNGQRLKGLVIHTRLISTPVQIVVFPPGCTIRAGTISCQAIFYPSGGATSTIVEVPS